MVIKRGSCLVMKPADTASPRAGWGLLTVTEGSDAFRNEETFPHLYSTELSIS